MSETTYEAENVEAALAQAAENMGAAAADLQYEVVQEKRDFWGGDEGTVLGEFEPGLHGAAVRTDREWQGALAA